MDLSEAKKTITDGSVHWLRWALQLQLHSITVKWRRIDCAQRIARDENVLGRCSVDPSYRRAIIEIDNDHHDSPEELLHTLRHEMLHVLLGQFEILRQQISKVVSDDMFEVLDVAWRDASERAVAMMEDALDNGLGLTPEKMIELAKTREQERNKEQGHAS